MSNRSRLHVSVDNPAGKTLHIVCGPHGTGGIGSDGKADAMPIEYKRHPRPAIAAGAVPTIPMNIDEVTKEQAKLLMKGLFPGGHYLARLKERMVKAGFPAIRSTIRGCERSL